jgi:hypothetical protein
MRAESGHGVDGHPDAVMDGIAATRKLTRLGARARVLILNTYDRGPVYEALRAGAGGSY